MIHRVDSLLYFISFIYLLFSLPTIKLQFVHADPIITGTPHSTVQLLDANNFDESLKDPANGLWLLKFYAPWCGHCKKLAPLLEDVAKYLTGKMAIGKIDCTVEKKLCNRFDVKGYPTIKVYRDGDFFDYPGKRDADSIIIFGEKMSSHSVQLVFSYKEVMDSIHSSSASVNDNGVAFIAYDADASAHHRYSKSDHHDNKDQRNQTSLHLHTDQLLLSTPALQVFGQVARKMQARAAFFLLHPSSPKEEISQFGAFFQNQKFFFSKVEPDVDPILYLPNAINKDEEFSTKSFLRFVEQNNIALVSNLDAHTFRSIGNMGKPLVIAVVDPDNVETTQAFLTQLKSFAKSGPKDITNRYIFTSMNGKKWGKFLEQFSVNTTQSPQIFLLDVPKRLYWQNETLSTSVDSFLRAIAEGRIPSRKQLSSPSGSFIERKLDALFELLMDYAPYSLIALLIIFGLIFYSLTHLFHEDESVTVALGKKDS